MSDELWPHFAPFWSDLRKTAPGILLAGGYALFLKQVSLSSQLDISTLVRIERWRDQVPRVTKDLDLIAELNLIASPGDQKSLNEVLTIHAFKVVEVNARWQFEKRLEQDKSIIVDFHAPRPAEDQPGLRLQGRRVKPHPSLHQIGIHGRANPEAVGCELHPFVFSFHDLEIVIPNAVTLATMKLAAMRDRWNIAQNPEKSTDVRQREEDQARKHAQDVCRIIALMTREENTLVTNVIDAMRPTEAFTNAVKIKVDFFQEDGWATRNVEGFWQDEDLQLIRTTLDEWFR